MPKRRRLSPDDYTVGWVCALPIELAAAQEMLDETHEGIDNHDAAVVYTLGRISEHNAVLACLPKGQIGTNSAAMVAVQLQSAFPSIRVGVLVGIGGGVPSAADVRLGDVVVSQPGKLHGGVVQYDFGKSTPSGIERTGYLNAPPAILLEAVAKVQAKHHRGQTTLYDNIAHFDSLSAFSETNALEDVLFAADNGHVGGPTCKNCSKDKGLVQRGARDEGVVIHYGTIASGNLVIRDGLERDRVSSELGNVHCFEMEAAGLMNTFPCLVIRGICDYADSHKNKDWQPHASAMAAAYAKKLLSVVPPAAVARARTVVEILTESKVIQDTLSRLPYAVEAIFNSYQRQHERTCLVETRTQVLQEINSWANRADESSIFWLSGWAGIGKSTIARTIARKYHDEQRLGASFFFSKGGGDIGHAGKFATTIARQLANNIPPLQPLVCQAVAACGDIGTQSLSDQWRQLVFEPLSKLDNNTWSEPSYILVIDALDECDDDRSIRAILHLLTKAQPVFYKVVKVLITSRPNLPVRHGISQIPRPNHCKLILHELSPEDLDYDINVYLEHELSIIAQEVGLNLPWPGAEAIRQLVESASGLFIWSATACRFIHEGGMFAEERLNTILQPKESRTAPEESLNEIYSSVLNSSVGPTLEPQEREIFCTLLRQILGTIVVLSSPLSLGSIGNLLQVRKRWLDNVMDQLHAILDIPDDTSRPLRLHHPSFRDFLLDEDRCKDPKFWVDEKKAHGLLADRCLQLMSSTLKEDICGVGAPGTPRDELNETQIQQFLPLEVQYACLFWVQHLGKSNTTLKDDDAVHKFLNDNVLYWFEALSWIQRLPQGIFALITLESIALQGKCSQLQDLIWGIKRFAQASKSVMEEAPLQVYLGSLVFAPSSSIVRNRFQDRALKWVRKVPTFRTNWSPLQQTLESHSRGACSVLFSPDGTILAYASWDTVQLWDPLTGQCLQTLKENSDLPNDYDRPLRRDIYKTIAFSNIGKILASTSDRTLDLWDWSTGLSLQTFKGHNGLITQIAFSCDAETIASGSTDQTVRLWSPYTGKSLGILTGHTGCIHAVAFSPASQSANILASASDDSTIRVWNSFTGQCLSILHTNNPINHALVFSSDGGMLASARGGRGETVYFSSPGTWDFNQSVHLWDPLRGKPLHTLDGHIKVVSAIAFSPNGEILASSDDETVRIWDIVDGQCLQVLWHSQRVLDISFSPDGKILASLSLAKEIQLWNPLNGECLQTLDGHMDYGCAITFSPRSDGNRYVLASAAWNGTLILWNTSDELNQGSLGSQRKILPDVRPSPDGKILATVSDDNSIQIWDLQTAKLSHTLTGHTIEFSPDGKILASLFSNTKVRLWDISSGQCLRTLVGDTASDPTQSSITFSPDGKMMSLTCETATWVWDPYTGQSLLRFRSQYLETVSRVIFSPDGKRLASLHSDEMVQFWEISSGKCPLSFRAGSYIFFSPDWKTMASCSSFGLLQLWDVSSGACLHTLRGHANHILDHILAMAFSHDGKIFASSSAYSHDASQYSSLGLRRNSVILRDPRTGQCLCTLEGVPQMDYLAFSDDDVYLKTNLGTTILESRGVEDASKDVSKGLFFDGAWVTWNGEKVLWFPPEYRSHRMFVYENVFAAVYRDCQVVLLDFNFH